MKKTENKWKTDRCALCGEPHTAYTGKLDKDKVEYVICGTLQKRINCRNGWKLMNEKEILWPGILVSFVFLFMMGIAVIHTINFISNYGVSAFLRCIIYGV